MRHHRAFALLPILFTCIGLSAAQTIRYFKAEHGVGATYVKLGTDGSYKVIDREHMGIFLTDEGHWQQTGTVITFRPKDTKKSSYQATENEHKGETFLGITSPDAAAGIVIASEDIDKDLDATQNHLPDHVLFKVSAKTYQTETKQTYPFRYLGRQSIGDKSQLHSLTLLGQFSNYVRAARDNNQSPLCSVPSSVYFLWQAGHLSAVA